MKLTILHDQSPENPWESFDNMIPLYMQGGRDFGNTFYNLTLLDLLHEIPQSKLTKKTLLLLCEDVDYDDNIYASREDFKTSQDYISTVLSYALKDTDDTMKTIITLCDLANIRYYRWTSTGYSQGDYIDCILVDTKKYIDTNGIKSNSRECLKLFKEYAKLLDLYTWGDVYGYKISNYLPLTRHDGTLSTETKEEIIDSGWGFYGLDELKDHIKSEYPDLLDQFETASDNIIY